MCGWHTENEKGKEGEQSLQFTRGERNESVSLYLPGMGCTLHAKAKGTFFSWSLKALGTALNREGWHHTFAFV